MITFYKQLSLASGHMEWWVFQNDSLSKGLFKYVRHTAYGDRPEYESGRLVSFVAPELWEVSSNKDIENKDIEFGHETLLPYIAALPEELYIRFLLEGSKIALYIREHKLR